ncbi:unnamed protein product [Dicrocoelium dendriticum]|nr:unnamed protein product [Dicrocoelium dendriticum]
MDRVAAVPSEHVLGDKFSPDSIISSSTSDSLTSSCGHSVTGFHTGEGNSITDRCLLMGQLKGLTSNEPSGTHAIGQLWGMVRQTSQGQLNSVCHSINPSWPSSTPNASAKSQRTRSARVESKDMCFCGPGRKRYFIAFLCCTCLTIVIGMRSEMLGIMTNLNNTTPLSATTRRSSFERGAPVGNTAIYLSSHDSGMHPSLDIDGVHHSPEVISDSRRHMTSLIFKPSEHRQMPWTTAIKNDVVENAIFFAYLITSPIGGYLTVNHDSSFLLGCSVAMTCGMNLFLPLVETIGNDVNAKFIVVILLRLIQGLAEGCLIPAVFGILRFWGPEAERSTLVCLAVIGVSLGPLIGLPVCAEIEKKWGWGVVFYIYANLGLVWCIFWWRLIDEKPNKDEKLSKTERAYLQANISNRVLNSQGHTIIPWHAILRSRPIFAILLTYAADDWTFQISSVCMQSFYQQIYNVDVERTIFLLSFPFLSRSIFVPIGESKNCYLWPWQQ